MCPVKWRVELARYIGSSLLRSLLNHQGDLHGLYMPAAPPFPLHSPLTVADAAAVGGGRGVYAQCELQPGQLLLKESPLVLVPDDKTPQVCLCV